LNVTQDFVVFCQYVVEAQTGLTIGGEREHAPVLGLGVAETEGGNASVRVKGLQGLAQDRDHLLVGVLDVWVLVGKKVLVTHRN